MTEAERCFGNKLIDDPSIWNYY